MLILFQHRRLTSLIVSLAILLNLCVPAISQAVAVLDSDPLAPEICSASAAAQGRPDAGKQAPGGLPPHALKHCVLCALHAGDDMPPAAPAGILAVLDGHDAYPAPRPAAPAPQLFWSDAQARGPPASA